MKLYFTQSFPLYYPNTREKGEKMSSFLVLSVAGMMSHNDKIKKWHGEQGPVEVPPLTQLLAHVSGTALFESLMPALLGCTTVEPPGNLVSK
jgi:hypothetical protein